MAYYYISIENIGIRDELMTNTYLMKVANKYPECIAQQGTMYNLPRFVMY